MTVLPLVAHLTFSWLVLLVYGVACSGLGEGVQDLAGGGSEPGLRLGFRCDGGEEVDQSAIGVAHDTERLPHGMSVGSSTTSGTRPGSGHPQGARRLLSRLPSRSLHVRAITQHA